MIRKPCRGGWHLVVATNGLFDATREVAMGGSSRYDRDGQPAMADGESGGGDLN
ncbi:MAG: hypothetical protein L0216_18795 [Planctomycetales bacterium]|nr:hypothetical protein [Planctomycetales bacterium]